MNGQSARLALAEAMQLHNERVDKAEQRWDSLLARLKEAEADVMAARRYRDAFNKAILYQDPMLYPPTRRLGREDEEVGRGRG